MELTWIKRLGWSLVVLIFLAFLSFSIWSYRNAAPNIDLTIGAGSSKGEAYNFALAIADLTQKYFPNIKVKVLETKGSAENMSLLTQNKIQLATVQADIESAPSARLISSLYPDLFQLVVHQDAQINSFRDLKGKKVALPSKGGGQYISFWFIADHFGITAEDIEVFHFSSVTEEIEAIKNRTVDALFRVRAPKNETISRIIKQCPASIVSIDQGSAIKLTQPAISVTTIPEGTYRGNPPIPEMDIPTIGVDRLLVARSDADIIAIRLITSLLFERRRELLQITPLAGFITQPNIGEGTFIPVHNGAQQYFNREKPLYIVENADFFALIVSIFIGLISAAIWIRSYFQDKQKNKADYYAKDIVKMIFEIRKTEDPNFLANQKTKIMDILAKVVDDLDHDVINTEGFKFFSFTWQVAHDAIQEKEEELKNAGNHSLSTSNTDTAEER